MTQERTRANREFFTAEYLPACLDGIGAWRWPDGESMYGFLARNFTTTKLTQNMMCAITIVV